jgi:dCMP deaminase
MHLLNVIKSETSRPSWSEYFMSIACLTSLRSNCIKRKVGAIVVKENRILSLGYNGTPFGLPNCLDGGCKRCADGTNAGSHLDLCMCLHAEENALMFVSQKDLLNATLYCTLIPCLSCMKKIVQSGIKTVYYHDDYQHELDALTKQLSVDANVTLCKIKN